MTDTASLIDTVLQAPLERREAILQAARGSDRPRPGTVKQAAACFQPPVCPKTVERYADKGLLTRIRISPRCIRYDLNEVERLSTRGAGKAA